MAKVALGFVFAKKSKNLERYLMHRVQGCYKESIVQSNLALRNFLVTTKKFLKVKSSLFQTFNQSTISGILDEESRENGYFLGINTFVNKKISA